MNFTRVCAILAAWNCYCSGASVIEIAKQARKAPSTIRRWFKAAGFKVKS